ncbi:Hypothetical predicted protein [Cloeon dipterum]|uniref:Uncharacterized protein n=1 Tax=Cloeon dipterum TaxID=197152 RepID=A0A8S1DL86_9INSE|nr:Hypothetical predicted protein [Cloeon dipterum]
MSKKRFVQCLLFILANVELISSNSRVPINYLREDLYRLTKDKSIGPLEFKFDTHHATQWTMFNSKKVAEELWVNMDKENGVKTVMNHIGPEVIHLPFEFQFFDLNIRKIEVLKEGGVRSADPKTNWFMIPVTVGKLGLTPCQIRFFFKVPSLAIQWKFREHCSMEDQSTELSFQMSLFMTGRIEFIYKKIPFGNLRNFRANFADIGQKIGVNYRYELPKLNTHFVLGIELNVDELEIEENTVINVKSRQMCTNYRTCGSCLSEKTKYLTQLDCYWCRKLEMCTSLRDFLGDFWESCDIFTYEQPFCGEILYQGVTEKDDSDYIESFFMMYYAATAISMLILIVILVIMFRLGCFINFNFDFIHHQGGRGRQGRQ